jgi:hypothetical protein
MNGEAPTAKKVSGTFFAPQTRRLSFFRVFLGFLALAGSFAPKKVPDTFFAHVVVLPLAA